jgi:hypothetical protein
MRSLYSRPHRGSIYEPASVHDIPQEVLEKALILLPRRDLLAASSSCRAWRPVAQLLIYDRVKLSYGDAEKRNREMMMSLPERTERSICGYQLNFLVFGPLSYRITTLSLGIGQIGKEYIPMIAQIVAPSLISLELDFNEFVIYQNYEPFLETFFSRCQLLRKLRLAGYQGRIQSIESVGFVQVYWKNPRFLRIHTNPQP